MAKVKISTYEFLQKFPEDKTARNHLEVHRWRGKPFCPHCGGAGNMHKQSRDGVDGYYRCPDCRKTFTVRTGTIFERSHVKLEALRHVPAGDFAQGSIFLATLQRARHHAEIRMVHAPARP